MPKPVTPPAPPRPWYWDTLASCAFWGIAFLSAKGVGRLFGPFGGLFFFAITVGLGWMFGRAAWHSFLGRRGL